MLQPRYLLAFLYFLTACAPADKAPPKEIIEGTPNEVAPSMATAVCACYNELADAVRVSQSPAFAERMMAEKNSFMRGIDSMSKTATLCFAGVKEHYKITDKKKKWAKEEKEKFEDELSAELKKNCENVGKLLAGEKFY